MKHILPGSYLAITTVILSRKTIVLFGVLFLGFFFSFCLAEVDLLPPAFIFTSFRPLGNRAWIRKLYSEKNDKSLGIIF